MEYIDGGELFNHVQRHGFLPESEVRGTIVQILKAVEFMHANRIVHRDLKLVSFFSINV